MQRSLPATLPGRPYRFTVEGIAVLSATRDPIAAGIAPAKLDCNGCNRRNAQSAARLSPDAIASCIARITAMRARI